MDDNAKQWGGTRRQVTLSRNFRGELKEQLVSMKRAVQRVVLSDITSAAGPSEVGCVKVTWDKYQEPSPQAAGLLWAIDA